MPSSRSPQPNPGEQESGDGGGFRFAEPRSAYVHIPFCRRRCGYCNFTVTAGRNDLQAAFLQAINRELSAQQHPQSMETLFLGGGTPTQLTPQNLRQLVDLLNIRLPLRAGGEFSCEANPEDLDAEMLETLLACGVNRISLGLQSFDDGKLQVLQREHRRDDAWQALQRCRERFDSVAVDLIFAVPGEDLATWKADLAAAVEAGVQHISTYGLTYEKGAAFWSARRRGALQSVAEEMELAMYESAIEILAAAGFEHYEVSNFARPGHRCRHNVTYWQGGEYLAFGPGAARFVGGWRETNHRSTSTYLQRVLSGRSPVAERESLPPGERARERFVFQMRMLEGVSREAFRRQAGISVDQLLGDLLPEFVSWGLLEDNGDRIRLTRRGLLVSDALWARVLTEEPGG